jgi:hypothetical protein
MRDRTEAHALRRLRGECRTPAASAKEYEAFVLGKGRLVMGLSGSIQNSSMPRGQ